MHLDYEISEDILKKLKPELILVKILKYQSFWINVDRIQAQTSKIIKKLQTAWIEKPRATCKETFGG